MANRHNPDPGPEPSKFRPKRTMTDWNGRHPANNAKMLARSERQEKVLQYVAAHGGDPRGICEAIGLPWGTYCNWRSRFPEWGSRFDEAREIANRGGRDFDGTFTSFRRIYLRMETTWFQRQIIEAIESARAGEVILVLLPPGHGKTTLLEDWCTYKLVTDPSYRVTVGSETIDHGYKIVERVRNRFEMDGPTPTIPAEFGPIHTGDPNQIWSARRFNVARKRTSDERDYSMNCVGITGRVQGTRCDLLLLDDMQDVKSIELSQKYYDIVVQSFLTRPEMFGRTVIIGTRVGEVDVYRKLIDAQIPDRVIRIPAYKVSESPPWPAPEVKPDINKPETWAPEGTQFLWPEKYNRVEDGGLPMPGLERFRYAALRFRVKEQAWWRNYMQRPEAASSMTFDAKTIDVMKDEQRSVVADPRPISGREDPTLESWFVNRPVPVVISVDPAVGGGNGVMAVACRPNRMEVLSAHLRFGLTKYSQIIELIEADCQRYSTPDSVVTVVVIEDKAFQKGLLRDDGLLELQRKYGFRIVPNTTNREKGDPDIGVPSLPFAMVREEITIPWSDELSRKEMHDLILQLSQWRPNVKGDKLAQDLVMCLWFAYRQWQGLRRLKVHQYVDNRSWRAAPSTLRRQARRTRSFKALRPRGYK